VERKEGVIHRKRCTGGRRRALVLLQKTMTSSHDCGKSSSSKGKGERAGKGERGVTNVLSAGGREVLNHPVLGEKGGFSEGREGRGVGIVELQKHPVYRKR